MNKKKLLISIATILLAVFSALIIIYFVFEARLRENSVRIVRDNDDIFNREFSALPEGIHILTDEEFMLAMEDETREMTDEEFREAVERDFEGAPARFSVNNPDRFDDNIIQREDQSSGTFNVLFIGDDARIDEDRGRSDSIILISYNRDTRVIKLTSFMRDTLVPMNLDALFWNRINILHAMGGPGRIINLLNSLFSLDIQRYAIVRFSGVFALVDALDGLDLYLTREEAALLNRIFPDYDPVSPGYNLLNGRQVLAYSRIRVLDNDLVRTQRQRYVLTGILDRILDTRSINEIFTIATFALDHVETNVPLSEIVMIGVDLFTGSRPAIEELRIPIDNSFNHAVFYGAYILTIDFEENIKALHEFLYGSSEGVRIPVFAFPEMDMIFYENDDEDEEQGEGEQGDE